MTKKRFLTALTIIIMAAVCIAIPILYFNSEWYLSKVENQFDYEIVGDSVTITGVNGIHYTIKDGHLNIPATLEGKPVTTIGAEAFKEIEELKTVSIPDSVTNIGSSAFMSCRNLITVTIPDSVIGIDAEAFLGCSSLTSAVFGSGITNIGPSVFQGTGLKKLVIPDGVTNIGNNAFAGCNKLVSVTIPTSVTSIEDSAFSSCSRLVSITIPASVTSIGSSAFWRCDNLIEVQNLSNLTIKVGSEDYGYIGYYAKNIYTATTGTSKLQTVDDYLFYADEETVCLMSYTGGASTLTLPEGFNGQSYEIYRYAFDGCTTLSSVTIGDGVKSIGEDAFGDCSGLTTVTIEDGVESIGSGVFSGCSKLASMALPFTGPSKDAKVDTHFSYIFGGAFGGDFGGVPESLKSVTIIGTSEIKANSFSNCSGLTSITVGDSVETIGKGAFNGCDGLTSITLPYAANLRYVFGEKSGLFSSSSAVPESLKSVTITGGSSIEDSAFVDCSNLTNIKIPDSVTNIGESAFSGCTALSSITISDYVESIGDSAFRGCTGLTSITIGEGVSSIGTYAFEGCEKLATVYYKGTAETWSSISIKSNNSKLTSAKRYYVD